MWRGQDPGHTMARSSFGKVAQRGGGKRRSAKQQSVAMLPGAPGSEKTSFSTFTNHSYLFLLFPD